MNIKQFAELHRIPQSKVKSLASELLGEVPAKFSDEQIQTLTTALGGATQQLLAESSNSNDPGILEEETSVNLALEDSSTTELNEKVREIIGEDLLKQNALLYISFLKQSFAENKFKLDAIVFQVEQAYYGGLQRYQHSLYEDGKLRVKRSSEAAIKLFSAQGIKEELEKNNPEETASLLREALNFFEGIE